MREHIREVVKSPRGTFRICIYFKGRCGKKELGIIGTPESIVCHSSSHVERCGRGIIFFSNLVTEFDNFDIKSEKLRKTFEFGISKSEEAYGSFFQIFDGRIRIYPHGQP